MKRLIEIRFIILLPILILVVGLYLIPPPAAPPPSKILRIDLASESYFVVDKELVNKVFIECENRLKSLADRIRNFNTVGYVLSWLGYLLGLLVATIVIITGRSISSLFDPTEARDLAELTEAARKTTIGKVYKLIVTFALLSILCTGASNKFMTESQIAEREIYRLRETAAYTRVQLDWAASQTDTLYALNLLEKLRTEVMVSK